MGNEVKLLECRQHKQMVPYTRYRLYYTHKIYTPEYIGSVVDKIIQYYYRQIFDRGGRVNG